MSERKTFFQKMAEFLFIVYVVSLYLFDANSDLVQYSRILFVPFAGCCIVYILQRKSITIGKNIMLVYICCGWMFASYFWATNQYIALIKIKTMWQIFLLFFLVYNLFANQEDAYNHLLKSLYVAGLVLLGYSIYVYGIKDTINLMSTHYYVRLGSEINQANVFGMQQATTVIVAFYYLLYKNRFKLFHILVMVTSFLYAMSSGSRKALLMVCIGVLFLIFKKYGIKQVYKICALLLIVSLIFVSVIQLPMFDTIRTRMEQAFDTLQGGSGDNSSETRLYMVKVGWNIYKERILTGFGAANYQVVSNFGRYAHNNFIEVLVNFGLIGFVLYYMIYWLAFKNLICLKNDAGKALLCIFLVRLMMEIAVVAYYDKLTWILLAFFMMKNEKIQNGCSVNNGDDEVNCTEIEKSYY